jgi:hypothetical protein
MISTLESSHRYLLFTDFPFWEGKIGFSCLTVRITLFLGVAFGKRTYEKSTASFGIGFAEFGSGGTVR